MKYRKKPLVVEAWVIGPCGDTPPPDWVMAGFAQYLLDWDGSSETMLIQTSEGPIKGNCGDYLIRGIRGELYACKPDIFAETYDPVEDAP
jgi:hypothetical protein